MDPLSVSASIAGLLTAAGVVSTVLHTLSRMPKTVEDVCREVVDIEVCLIQLQLFVHGARTAPPSRTALLMVEHVVVTLIGCVTTFSELEKALSSFKTDQSSSMVQRLRWVVKEPSISKILIRLQASKSSLNLLLATLTCVTMEEARVSSNELHSLVKDVLQSNKEMTSRIALLERNCGPALAATSIHTVTKQRGGDESMIRSDDDSLTIRSLRLTRSTATTVSGTYNKSFSYSFDDDLRRSRVYARNAQRFSTASLSSSANWSIGWSFFSDASLSEISNISVIRLPITPQDLWNSKHYTPHGSDAVAMAPKLPDTTLQHQNESRGSSGTTVRRIARSGVPLKLLISKPVIAKNTLGWDSSNTTSSQKTKSIAVTETVEVSSLPRDTPKSSGLKDINKDANPERFSGMSKAVTSPPQFVPPSPVLEMLTAKRAISRMNIFE